MENHGVLDSTNDFFHMFFLHLICLPRIQRAAAEFRDNHGLSSQRGQIPLQLWQTSVLGTAGFPNPAIDAVFQIDGDFGVEDDGPLPVLVTNNNIVIPENNFHVNDTTANLIRTVNPLHDDGNHGINLFIQLSFKQS